MPDWQRATLDHLADVRNDRVVPRAGDLTPYVGLEHIQAGRTRLLSVGRAGDAVSQKTVFRSGDVLFGKLRPALRKVVRVDFDGLCSTDILAIRPKVPDDGPFLEQLLASEAFTSHAVHTAAGTKMPRTSWADLRSYTFVCPSAGERRKIGCILRSVELAVARTQDLVAATNHLRSALLEELLIRGLPGRHAADWRAGTLGEVADVQTGRAVKKVAPGPAMVELPYLSVSNVKDGYLDLANVKTMRVPRQEVPRFALRPGDVLFTEGGDPDKLGRGCVWHGEIDPCLHQNHVFVVRPHASIRADFLAAYAAGRAAKAYFLAGAKQTTNLASINSTQLKQLPVPLPPLSEQDEMLSLLRAIPSAEQHLRGLIALKAAVANLLLSGRVAVRPLAGSPA
jgi:type I restriction enzyme S subunit